MGNRLVVNISRLLEWQKCQQKYDYRYRRRLVPPEPDRRHLLFGTAIHKGLEVWYDGRYDDAAALAAVERLYQEEDPYNDMLPLAVDMLKGYVKRFADDRSKIEPVASELTLEVPVGHLADGREVVVVGRLDTVVRMEGWEGLWHMQHKTVGSTVGLANYVRQYDLAWHERAYRLMLQVAYPGEQVNSTLLNLLRKTKVPSFDRVVVPVPDHLVERMKQDVLVLVEDMESGRPPVQNPQSCTLYNTLCPYHGLCLGLEEWPDQWAVAEEDYVDERNRNKEG